MKRVSFVYMCVYRAEWTASLVVVWSPVGLARS